MSTKDLEYATLASDVYKQNGTVSLVGWDPKTAQIILKLAVENDYFPIRVVLP